MEVERLTYKPQARFPGRDVLSQEEGLFPRTGESFPRDHPHQAQFPGGKYLKIGNYGIYYVTITLRQNSSGVTATAYQSEIMLTEITASRRV